VATSHPRIVVAHNENSPEMEALDTLIRDGLLDLAAFMVEKSWYGREREAVSLYVLGFLILKCDPNGPLKSPTQIGMDVAVVQHPGQGRKKLVCKDLVIWPNAAGNCWDKDRQPTQNPLAILEWKTRTDNVSEYDQKWLVEFSERVPEFTGYAVALNSAARWTSMTVAHVKNGAVNPNWIHFQPTDGR
jgi:hypothetical protein